VWEVVGGKQGEVGGVLDVIEGGMTYWDQKLEN